MITYTGPMRNALLAPLALLVWVTGASCAFGADDPKPAAPAPVTVTTIVGGIEPLGPTKPEEKVFRDTASWKAFWEKARGYLPPELRKIDFEKEVVIAVLAGEKRTGGWKIEVAKVERTPEGGLLVTVREKGPAPGAITTQALTYPYHIVCVPRPSGEIRFKRE